MSPHDGVGLDRPKRATESLEVDGFKLFRSTFQTVSEFSRLVMYELRGLLSSKECVHSMMELSSEDAAEVDDSWCSCSAEYEAHE